MLCFIILFYMWVCGPESVSVCTLSIQEPSETSDEDIGALRTAVECYELLEVGAGNQTLILYECSKCSQSWSPFSSPSFFYFKVPLSKCNYYSAKFTPNGCRVL